MRNRPRRHLGTVLQKNNVLNLFISIISLFCQRQSKRQYRYPKNKKKQYLPENPNSGALYAKASITIEAALTLPLFLFVLSIFLSFFTSQIWQLQLQKELDALTEQIAVWSCALDLADDYSGADLLAIAEGSRLPEDLSVSWQGMLEMVSGQMDLAEEAKLLMLENGSALLWQPLLKESLIQRVGREKLDRSFIKGGAQGLSLSGSTLHQRNLDLVLSYQMETFPGKPLGLSFPVVVRSCRRLWIGTRVEKEKSPQESEETEEEIVYITENGRVYHGDTHCRVFQIRPECINAALIGTLRSQDGSRYKPCDRCVVRKAAQETVWFTDFGNRYHYLADCPSLKRLIIEMALSEAREKYRPCGFCGGRTE